MKGQQLFDFFLEVGVIETVSNEFFFRRSTILTKLSFVEKGFEIKLLDLLRLPR